jgi:hypothetical protein
MLTVMSPLGPSLDAKEGLSRRALAWGTLAVQNPIRATSTMSDLTHETLDALLHDVSLMRVQLGGSVTYLDFRGASVETDLSAG